MTGLRQSELLGLRWRDVDWSAQRIRVRNTWVRGEHSTDGKSDLSTRRSVPMADRLLAALDDWSTRTIYNGDDHLVFAHPQTSNPLDGSKVTKRFQVACRDARAQAHSLPRPPLHLRYPAGRLRQGLAPHAPGIRRPCRRQDHADLCPLRTLRPRNRDGQRRCRCRAEEAKRSEDRV